MYVSSAHINVHVLLHIHMQISCTCLFALYFTLVALNSVPVSDANFLPYFQLLRLDREAGKPRFESMGMASFSPFNHSQSRKGFFLFDNNTYYANFWAFNFNFQILAHRKRTFGGERLNVNLVSEQKSRLLQFDENEFYNFEGSLLNYPQYSARGYVQEKSMVFIINVPLDNIFIVPASEYNLDNDTFNTIVYRESDSVNYWCSPLRRSSAPQKSCSLYQKSGYSQLDTDRPFRLLAQGVPMEPQCPVQHGKYCAIWTVADHLVKAAYGSVFTAVNEMLFHIRRVDCWFRATDFLGKGKPTNVGLKPVNITVFSERFHKNSVQDALQDFSEMSNTFCMGLIFLAKPDDHSEGNVIRKTPLCGEDGAGKASVAAVNVQQMMSKSNGREWISATVARMVAKVFGAEELERDNACLIPLHGGKYIMGANAKFLNEENNFKFSNCSIRGMKEAIKADRCLDNDKNECGNGVVEEGEECDCGQREDECRKKDPCCTPVECRLRSGAKCSPYASGCCTDECKPARKGTPCSHLTDECMMVDKCTGSDAECSPPKPQPNGTPCNQNARICQDGKCSLSICEYGKTKECLCMEGPQNLCYICCLADNQDCVPASTLEFASHLPPGRKISFKTPAGYPCGVGGVCDTNGTCIPEMKQLNKTEKRQLEDWSKQHWYLILIIVFVTLVCCCAICPRPTCGEEPPDEEFEELVEAASSAQQMKGEDNQKEDLEEEWFSFEENSLETGFHIAKKRVFERPKPSVAKIEQPKVSVLPPKPTIAKWSAIERSKASMNLPEDENEQVELDVFDDDSDEGTEIITGSAGQIGNLSDALLIGKPTGRESKSIVFDDDDDSFEFATVRSSQIKTIKPNK